MAPIAFLDATPKAKFISIDYGAESNIELNPNMISEYLKSFNYNCYLSKNKIFLILIVIILI